jgi:hypothetical protein
MTAFSLPGFDLDRFVRATLDEDLGVGLPGGGRDVTAESVIPTDARFSGAMDSRDAAICAADKLEIDIVDLLGLENRHSVSPRALRTLLRPDASGSPFTVNVFPRRFRQRLQAHETTTISLVFC